MPWKEYLQTILDNVFYNIDNTVIILVKKPLDLNSSQREDKKMFGKCLLLKTHVLHNTISQKKWGIRKKNDWSTVDVLTIASFTCTYFYYHYSL